MFDQLSETRKREQGVIVCGPEQLSSSTTGKKGLVTTRIQNDQAGEVNSIQSDRTSISNMER